MRLEDICIDIYREECERVSAEYLEIKDEEISEISLSDELASIIDGIDFSEQDTLVGAMRNPRQLGISLKRRFYHIPAFYIEEYAIPKYIALYQSQKMFGDEVSGIKYYGEVKKCMPMRRSKIREIPKKSNETYYKFNVKKRNRIDTLVKAKEIGFVRLFTNLSLLQNVSEVSALTISNAYDLKLYKLLESANDAVGGECGLAHFVLDGLDVVFTKHIIYLCKNGRIVERYWQTSLESKPSLVLNKIKKDMARVADDPNRGKENEYEIQNI